MVNDGHIEFVVTEWDCNINSGTSPKDIVSETKMGAVQSGYVITEPIEIGFHPAIHSSTLRF